MEGKPVECTKETVCMTSLYTQEKIHRTPRKIKRKKNIRLYNENSSHNERK